VKSFASRQAGKATPTNTVVDLLAKLKKCKSGSIGKVNSLRSNFSNPKSPTFQWKDALTPPLLHFTLGEQTLSSESSNHLSSTRDSTGINNLTTTKCGCSSLGPVH